MLNALMGLQAGGAMLDALGAFMGAGAQRRQLRFEADMADFNARQAEGSAQRALDAGQWEERRARLATAQLKGRQRAAMAAGNVDLGAGSALQLQAETDLMGQIDAQQIAVNAVRSAWGYRTAALNATNDASARRAQASSINPTLSTGTSLLASATRVAPQWYALSQRDAGLSTSGARAPTDPPTSYWGW